MQIQPTQPQEDTNAFPIGTKQPENSFIDKAVTDRRLVFKHLIINAQKKSCSISRPIFNKIARFLDCKAKRKKCLLGEKVVLY
jgi:hypothetical protein